MTSAEIELLVSKYIENSADKIADKCVERIKNAQHDCEAFRIFRHQDNVLRFFNTEKKIDDHIGFHKKKEVESEKLFERRHKTIMIFVSLISLPSFISMTSKILAIIKG